MQRQHQFSLAFLFLQIFWIALALASFRAVIAIYSAAFPVGLVGLLPVLAIPLALGAFVGGFFRKTIVGGLVGLISLPVLIAILFLVAWVMDTFQIGGSWSE